MSQTEIGQLAVTFEARYRDLEKQMQKASRINATHFKAMEKRADDAAKRMEKSFDGIGNRIGQNLKGVTTALSGALALLSFDNLAGQYRQIATGVANIGNEARRAGLSLKSFQELKFVADQNRIAVDALVDGFKELHIRADEYLVDGTGAGADAFKRLGFEASDLKKRLEDPSELLVEIIRRMETLDKAAQRRLAEDIFGGEGGEQFVELLNRGSIGIKQMVKDAREFGLVLDDAMINRADEVDRKFNLLATTVGTRVKSALLDATEALTRFLDQFNQLDQRQADTLRKQINENFVKQADTRYVIDSLEEKKGKIFGILDTPIERQITKHREELAELEAEYKRLQAVLDVRNGFNPNAPSKPAPAPETAPAWKPISTKPNDVLFARLAAGKSREHIEGLSSDLASALTKALSSAPESVRNATTINSGYRSFERQAQLWTEALKKYGSLEAARKWVAPPGKSQHQDGEAADLGFKTAEARKWFHDNAENYGLTFPMQHEPWHVETTGARRKANDEAFKEKWDKQEEQSNAYKQIIKDAGEFVASQKVERDALAKTGVAAAQLRYQHQLLAQMESSGLEVTKERAQAIEDYAARMAEAEVATEQFALAQEKAQHAKEIVQGLASEGFKGFISDLRQGVSATEALGNAFGRLADRLLDMAIDGIFSQIFGSTVFGSIFGFAKGGIAAGGKAQPLQRFAKGGVSRSAAIFGEAGPEAAVPLPDGRSIPVTLSMPAMPAKMAASNVSSQIVNVSPNIVVNAAAGGDPAANADAAKKTAAAVEAVVDAKIAKALQTAMRPGGMFRSGR